MESIGIYVEGKFHKERLFNNYEFQLNNNDLMIPLMPVLEKSFKTCEKLSKVSISKIYSKFFK